MENAGSWRGCAQFPASPPEDPAPEGAMSTHAVNTNMSRRDEDDAPVVIPAVELHGSLVDRLRTIDAAITRLQSARRALSREPVPGAPANEVYGRYINAPVWPWTVAGWALAVIFMLLFVMTWLGS
jgi:hypothetical protein